MNDLLTTAEVAERWGCTQQWVQALCKRGKLKAQLMGNSYIVRQRDADNYEHGSPGRPGQNGTRKHGAPKRKRKQRTGRAVKS